MTTNNHTQSVKLNQEVCNLLPFDSLTDDELIAAIYHSSPSPLMLELAHRLETHINIE
jgi:hypothetical protein